MPQFEEVMAEKEQLTGRAASLERDLKEAASQQQQLQASLRRAQEVWPSMLLPQINRLLFLFQQST